MSVYERVPTPSGSNLLERNSANSEREGVIDISWVDWAFKSSICDVICIVDSAAIYIMVHGQI
jgi:hypothetical protein